jgi:hypothetical protein
MNRRKSDGEMSDRAAGTLSLFELEREASCIRSRQDFGWVVFAEECTVGGVVIAGTEVVFDFAYESSHASDSTLQARRSPTARSFGSMHSLPLLVQAFSKAAAEGPSCGARDWRTMAELLQ